MVSIRESPLGYKRAVTETELRELSGCDFTQLCPFLTNHPQGAAKDVRSEVSEGVRLARSRVRRNVVFSLAFDGVDNPQNLLNES